jgi:hypothetical protein
MIINNKYIIRIITTTRGRTILKQYVVCQNEDGAVRCSVFFFLQAKTFSEVSALVYFPCKGTLC